MTFRDYAQYSLSEFLEDDSFVQWVINPNSKADSYWQSFLASHPEKEAVIREAVYMITVYRKQEVFTNEQRREEVWKRIDTSIQVHNISTAKKIQYRPFYLKVAASLALLVSCAVAVWILGNDHTRTVATAYGEVKAITLPDQSIVMLNGNSLLRYEDAWDDRSPREVWIKGEAYFDVKHLNRDTSSVSPGDRFIVHGNGLDIQVLGTSFNVKSRRNKTNIALLTGKIEVSYADASSISSGGLVMLPGDYVEYAGQKLVTKKKLQRPHKVATWTVREITFSDPTLNDIVEALQDNYGYGVNVDDQDLMTMKIEGEISVTTVQELLAVVSSTLGIRIEASGKEIIIRRQ